MSWLAGRKRIADEHLLFLAIFFAKLFEHFRHGVPRNLYGSVVSLGAIGPRAVQSHRASTSGGNDTTPSSKLGVRIDFDGRPRANALSFRRRHKS
jgi:hypothetical protein